MITILTIAFHLSVLFLIQYLAYQNGLMRGRSKFMTNFRLNMKERVYDSQYKADGYQDAVRDVLSAMAASEPQLFMLFKWFDKRKEKKDGLQTTNS